MNDYFYSIEKKIKNNIKELTLKNFDNLWSSKESLRKHIDKRIKKGHIKDEKDYLEKIKETFFNPDKIYLKKFNSNFKKEFNRLDRIFYRKDEWWVDIFLENGNIATAFKKERGWREILYKGDQNNFEIFVIKRMKNGYEIKKDD